MRRLGASRLSFRIVPFSGDDRDLWNEWVRSNPWASFYHLWEWGEVLCKTYGYQRYYIGAKQGDKLVGVLPLIYIRSRIFADKLVSLPFAEYGGPLLMDPLDSSDEKSALTVFSERISALAAGLSVDYVDLRQPRFPLSLTLPAYVSKPLRRYVTFVLDLTEDESELWSRLDKKCRNAVRKARKSGVRIKEVDFDDVGQYYRLHLLTESRHGSPPHSAAFFRNILDMFRPEGLRMTLTLYDGQAIGGIMAFSFGTKIYWFNNVLDRDYASLNPTNLLLWHLIEWGIQNDFETLDLGQTRPAETGTYRFKRGWSGREVPLENQVLMMKNAEVPDPLQRKYLILSRLWSMLPQAVVSQVGPSIISKIAI